MVLNDGDVVDFFTICEFCGQDIDKGIFDLSANAVNWTCDSCNEESGVMDWIIDCELCGNEISRVTDCCENSESVVA